MVLPKNQTANSKKSGRYWKKYPRIFLKSNECLRNDYSKDKKANAIICSRIQRIIDERKCICRNFELPDGTFVKEGISAYEFCPESKYTVVSESGRKQVHIQPAGWFCQKCDKFYLKDKNFPLRVN